MEIAMNFSDIFKQSFLDGFVGTELGFKEILMVFLITACLAAYIFLVYRVVTRRTFYSKNFNIALAMLCMITAAVILTIQFSIVISLGMVGALSIVRFRTAVKDPMDLVFLFWSIGTGIICGAGLAEIAVILALLLTAGVLLLDRLPVVSVPMLLVVNADDAEAEEKIVETAKQYSRYCKVKSRNLAGDRLNMIVELRTRQESELVRAVNGLQHVSSVSLLAHDGEATY